MMGLFAHGFATQSREMMHTLAVSDQVFVMIRLMAGNEENVSKLKFESLLAERDVLKQESKRLSAIAKDLKDSAADEWDEAINCKDTSDDKNKEGLLL
jgi:hypothetical protein